MEKLFIFKNCFLAKGPLTNMRMKYARARDLHSFKLEMPPLIAWCMRKPKNIMASIGWASGGTIHKQCKLVALRFMVNLPPLILTNITGSSNTDRMKPKSLGKTGCRESQTTGKTAMKTALWPTSCRNLNT